MKDLEKLGLKEMTNQELSTTEGGLFGVLIFLAIAVTAAIFASDGNDRTRAYIDGERVGY